jgi:uncharacterized protein
MEQDAAGLQRLKPLLQGPGEQATLGLSLVDSGEGLLGEKRQQDGRTPTKSYAVRAVLTALNVYKVWLSPLLAGSCRYQPTCSRYAYEAIERFGVARGVWLGTKRLLRCHPFTKRFGYDPVPEKWEEMRREMWERQVEAGRPEERPVQGGVRS